MNSTEKLTLKKLACQARMGAVIGTYHAKSGHPGGSLSAADLYTYLYFKEMNVDPQDPKNRTGTALFFQKAIAAQAFTRCSRSKAILRSMNLRSSGTWALCSRAIPI